MGFKTEPAKETLRFHTQTLFAKIRYLAMLALTRRKALFLLAMETPVTAIGEICTCEDMLKELGLVIEATATPYDRTTKTLIMSYLIWSRQISIIRHPRKEPPDGS
jgi:hypothetical protein